MFSYLRRIQIFFQKGTPNFDIFSSVVFYGKIILKHIETKKALGGSGNMPSRKIFENLRAIVAILALIEQLLGIFFAPKSESFIKYDAFCLYISDYACLGRKAYS